MGYSLQGSSVLVIGGSSGIGLATARMAREQGATVTIAARGADRLKAAQDEIGGDIEARCVDVAEEDEVRELLEEVGSVDHVVTLAGSQVFGRIAELPTADLHRPMDVRFWGSLFICKHAGPRLSERGSITLCSGIVAERPMVGRAMGTASTAATEAFARAMALELAPIRVNAIRPGAVDTPLLSRVANDDRGDFLAAEAARLPTGRVGRPEDLAHGILFLMQNPYVTGITLTLDGGRLLL